MASGQCYPGQNMNPQQRFGPQSNPMARFQQPMGYGSPSRTQYTNVPQHSQMSSQMQPGQHQQIGTPHRTMSMGQHGPPGMPPPSGPGMHPPGPGMPHGYPPATTSTSPSTTSTGKSSSSSKGKAKDKDTRDKDRDGDEGMHRGGMSPAMQAAMERKRGAPDQRQQQIKSKKKKKLADKILTQRVRELVPESEAYMDLLAFERKLDSTIMRKRLDIQEALKRPMKQKKKLRIFISNTFYPPKVEDGEDHVASWELRVEGRLLEESHRSDAARVKKKFSSFFKSLVIELDKDLYGPDNHLVEWHRTPQTQETDGFQVKRPGDQNVKCTVLFMLDYQPMQYKLDPRLARLLGIHTQTRPVIVNALWQYIKTHKLQDSQEREYINCDKYLEQIFDCQRMKFSEIPQRLHSLLMPPDPIVINHVITCANLQPTKVDGPDAKKTACYDIDVEVDDTLKQQMNSFLLSTQSQQEIAGLDSKIHETVESINHLKTSRDFFLGFAKDPQEFINNWLVSQTRDLKTMTDVAGNPEEERHAEFYYQSWSQEAVSRFFYGKVQQRRAELEQALGIRNT